MNDETPSSDAPYIDENEDRPQAPEIKPPSARRRLSYTLFSRETRTGRFLRGLGRWLAVISLLIGLGILAAYLFFIRPLDQELQSARARADETAVDLQRAQRDLEAARSAEEAAVGRAERAQASLTTEVTRGQVLRALASLKDAQMAVQDEDKAAALRSLKASEDTLKQAQPRLNGVDGNATSTLQALFTLVRNGMERDIKTAAEDMDRLAAELVRLERGLGN
jgi:hypothetical protein